MNRSPLKDIWVLATTLLLAAEDLRTLSPSTLSSGPVRSGSVQPERRADLRAEIAAVVLQSLMVVSTEAEARSRPSREKARERTSSV